jgi:uncharacterized protein with GYD domain
MSLYLARFGYTADAWAALIREPQDREAAIRPMFEKAGATLHGLWYAFGEYDGYVLYDAPDVASATAISVAVCSSGAISSFATTPLITVAEMVEALKRAAGLEYRAPTEAGIPA